MALKTLIAVIATVILFAAGAKLTQDKKISPEEWKNWHSLPSVAKRAKAEGKSSVVIPGPIIEYGGENVSFQEAVQYYSIIVAEPVESKSHVSDPDHIVTWHRCKIREVLSMRAPLICNTCPRPDTPPTDIDPAREDELLLLKTGGTAVVDGVEITMTNDIPEFRLNQRYLLFLILMPDRTAILGGGPTGLFEITDNDILKPAARKSRLTREIQQSINLKLSELRAFLNH